jgi:2-amino-4-hydroxy-6-hydroxymethyldihydropteridine diphosphokinase
MVYIALGSNQGNRFKFLEKAVKQIGTKIGTIKSISPIYETEAWGFKGNAFLNACLKLETDKEALSIMDLLLSIENEFGRKRTSEKGYQSRPIDLDILLYQNEVINHKRLQIPHPRMELRQFVLTPLSDIASEIIHPKIKKSIGELQLNCTDKSPLSLCQKSLEF